MQLTLIKSQFNNEGIKVFLIVSNLKLKKALLNRITDSVIIQII
jgi:hypothetical protein